MDSKFISSGEKSPPENSQEEIKTFYLIDGTAYIYRAYHAVRNLSNSKGLPTNAVFGFTRMILKLMNDRQPDYAAMFFDAKGPTFRHELYPKYKANRPPMPEELKVQLPYIKQITAGFNLPVFEIPGYEADDLIGTAAVLVEAAGFKVVMVTGDKDFMQLVTDRATIWDPMKYKTIDINSIREDFGVEPKQIIDVMGLSGDTADNVPGVPGIGLKTALSLMKTYHSISGLYKKIDAITKKKQRENLINFKNQALMSRTLVTINTHAPMQLNEQDLRVKKPDNSKLSELFRVLEFRQLQQEFFKSPQHVEKKYTSIQKVADLTKLISRLSAATSFALDTETTSTNPMEAELVGLSFAIQPNEAYYIPCTHDDPNAARQLTLSTVLEMLKPILENPEIRKIGQNIKYDWMVLQRYDITLSGVSFDTMLASYLLNPSKRAHNLDQIALDFLGHKTITYKAVVGKGKGSDGFRSVPIEKAVPYACEDADITLMASNILQPKLEKANLVNLLETVEMPLIPVLMKMEMQGVCVDRGRLRELSQSFHEELETLKEKIYNAAGQRFNIRSPQQLGGILFDKLGLPMQKKTKKKTGYSTDVNVLTALEAHHELPTLVLRHRSLSKLKSTYTDALLSLINKKTGRVHTSFNQTVTATGRLSSSAPNLQNIPIRTEQGRKIRSAFIPRKGWRLLSADYSQIELRILAHCSEDQILIKAFNEDEDIHTRTATEIFNVFPSFITPELRRQAKIINFGIIYGMGAFSLAKELNISRKMAATYIDNYFNRYSGVKAFIEQTLETVRQTKQTNTLLGRIRILPEIGSSNRNVRGFAERTAINTPIQGTAADLIKVAMIKLDHELRKQQLQSPMLLSVHDEIILEVPPEEFDEVTHLVKTVMEGVWDLHVPLKVNLSSGMNWAEAH